MDWLHSGATVKETVFQLFNMKISFSFSISENLPNIIDIAFPPSIAPSPISTHMLFVLGCHIVTTNLNEFIFQTRTATKILRTDPKSWENFKNMLQKITLN